MIKRLLLLGIIWLSVTGVSAQSPYFQNKALLKGQENYTVDHIFQDSLGYIWAGTNKGLVKMVNNQLKQYSTQQGLASDVVTAINADRNGMLFVGHANGTISKLNDETFSQFQRDDLNINEKISTFFFDASNNPWVGTLGGGVFYLSPDSVYQYNSLTGLNDNYVYTITQGPQGAIWMGTDNGIAVHKNGDFRFITMKDGLPDNIVKKLLFDKNGILWIGMEQGLASYNPESGKFTPVGNWQWGTINTFVRMWPDEFWVSTKQNGIARVTMENDTTITRVFMKKDGLLSNKTSTIFRDSEYNIWIGTQGGVTQYTGDMVEFMNNFNELPFRQAYDFSIDEKGNYWVTSDKGLFKMQPDAQGNFAVTNVMDSEKYAHHAFLSLYRAPDGYMWVSTYGFGVYRIHPEKLTIEHFSKEDGLSNGNIMHISGHDSILWLSTLGGGASRMVTKGDYPVKVFDESSGLGSNYLYSTFTDSKNRVWFAQDGGGVTMYNGDTFTTYDTTDGLFNQVIYGFAEGKKGGIWCNSNDGGVYRFKNDTFTHYTMDDGLLSNEITALKASEGGDIMFVSNMGVNVYFHEDERFNSLGEDHGLAYWEPNVNGVFRDSANAFWIATNNGILKFNYKTRRHETEPHVFISKKMLYYKEIEKERMQLNYDENHLIFEYQGLWYKAPEKLRYRYRLKGQTEQWSPATKSKTVTYSNLPPGEYQFEVQVSASPNKWCSSKEAKYQFLVQPPIWQRWWFIALVALLVLGIILLVFRLRTARLRRDKERLEAEVSKRTNEIRQQNEELESQRDEIKQKNESITNSIVYARRIQNAVLPPTNNLNTVFSDHFIFFKPRDIVSGDFYWLTRKQGYYIFAAADSTGHGVPGAFVSMLGVAFMNEILSKNNMEDLNAGEFLNQLRAQVVQSLHQEGKSGDTKDGMDIALCLLDAENKELHFAGANNPLLLVRNGKLKKYKGNRMPIGVHTKYDQPFTNHRIQMQTNDRIYIFSDGFQDQFGGPKDRKFLMTNFESLLFKNHQLPMDKQKQVLNDTFNEWSGDNAQVDDILVMGFQLKF